MAFEGLSTVAASRVLPAVTLLATACDGEGGSSATSETVTTAQHTSAELDAALLSAEDLGDGWSTEGPAHVDLGDGSTLHGARFRGRD